MQAHKPVQGETTVTFGTSKSMHVVGNISVSNYSNHILLQTGKFCGHGESNTL
jgi:hypothetical protein